MINSNYIVDPETGCWLWIRATDTSGYGRIWTGERLDGAHRVAWEEENGPIPEGMCVLHKCDVRRCVNPEHLFLGTHADNTLDMCIKGHTAYTKLTEEQVIDAFLSTDHPKDCGRRLGVSDAMIRAIRNGSRWGRITRSLPESCCA